VKAAYFSEHGGSDKILYGDYRDPVPAAGDAIVRVRACALNQVDMLLLDGRFPPPEGLPHVNGCEVAGTIETLGAGVTGLAAGQRVIVFPGFSCGTCEFCLIGERTVCLRYGYLGAHKDGGYAELCLAPASHVYPVPDDMPIEHAATFPTCYLTAAHALFDTGHLSAGETVLIHAAGGGVGTAATQLARNAGAEVFGTASATKHEAIRAQGVDHPIDYRNRDFEAEVLKSDTPVLVDFWAPWCGPCRMVAPIVAEISSEYDGKLKVGKVNTDDNQGVASRYGIMSIPTLMIFKNGQEVARIIGAQPKQALTGKIDAAIAG